jgi:glutathione S-transferase
VAPLRADRRDVDDGRPSLSPRHRPARPGRSRGAETARRAEEALGLLDGHLRTHAFLLGDAYTIADVATYGYVHVADEAGLDTARYPAVRDWLGRVESRPGHLNDLAPYPENARPGAGTSVYD